MPNGEHKGKPCPYRPITCQEDSGCQDCEIYQEYLQGELNGD